MDNNQLLAEVARLLEAQTKALDAKFDSMDAKFDLQSQTIYEKFDQVDARLTSIELTLENDVSKRIDILFDGYQLVTEKQWELEQDTRQLQKDVKQLQNQTA